MITIHDLLARRNELNLELIKVEAEIDARVAAHAIRAREASTEHPEPRPKNLPERVRRHLEAMS